VLIKILGWIDIAGGIILITKLISLLPNKALYFIGMLFLVKASFGFFKNFASWIDGVTGLIFLLSILIAVPWWILLIVSIFLFQKGGASFIEY